MSVSKVSKSLRLGGYCLASLMTALTFSASASAQQTPSIAQPGRVESQITRPDLSGPPAAEVNIPEIRIEGAPQGADSIHFILKSLDLEGVSAYSTDELGQLYAKDIGQDITLAHLYEIAGAITRKYRNDGYIISQVVVPVQTIDGGHAKLQVVEGSIDQVVVEGAAEGQDMAQIRQMGNKLKASQPLRSKDLERYLLLINDLPGVSARSIVGPSPTQPGKADVRIIISRRAADFFLGGDNYGSAYLGPWQITGAAKINNPFHLNDSLTAQIVKTPSDDELAYYYTEYKAPIGTEGTAIAADLSYSETAPGFDIKVFQPEGYATTLGLTLSHPFIRSRNENLSGRVRVEGKTSSTKNALGVSTDDDTRSVRIGGRYELLDTHLGTSVNMIDMQMSKGFEVFGASKKGDADLSRLGGNPSYTKFEAEITRLQRIIKDFNILVGVKGQKSTSALLSSEEFGVGGMSTGYGRGYDPSEIVGDSGFATKVEAQWNTHVFDNSIESLQLFGFYDAGTVWNTDATTSADKRNSVASTGIGARAHVTKDISADAIMAIPLTADVSTERDTNPRFFVSLSSRF